MHTLRGLKSCSGTVRLVRAAALLAVVAGSVSAQTAGPIQGAVGSVASGGELDNYLRYLQTLGQVPLAAWSLRAFSASETDTLTRVEGSHPWSSSWYFRRIASANYLRILPVTVAGRFNTTTPFGSNDGPVWAGRGLTSSAQGGVAFAWGPFSGTLDPIVFRAENGSFPLEATGVSGVGQYANGEYPTRVDLPQRFGNSAYSQLDWGESTLRADAFGLTVGITTANQWWGPATVFPVIVGNNAAGVPQVFVGTERPTNIGIGRFQARVVYGMESQSPYSPVSGSETFIDVNQTGTRRFMSGLIGTFSPGAIPGLEISAERYFHQAWQGSIGSYELRSPFEGILKNSIPVGINIAGIDDRDVLKNQLASLSMRWVFPHSGFEVYAEYGHEDHNYDLRDVIEEPDHTRIYTAGFRKVFVRDGNKFGALRMELIDGSAPSLLRHRNEGAVYTHYPIEQGHTEDGQLIGADIGVGSPFAEIVAWDSYSPDGRSTFYVQRVGEDSRVPFITTGIPTYTASHLAGTAGYERHRFGRALDVTYGAAITDERRAESLRREVNVNLSIALTAHLP